MAATSRLAAWFPGPAKIVALSPAEWRREVGAGLAVAAIAVPIGLAYARILGIPSQHGLYASIAATLAYALFGSSSRYLIVGPDTATCLLLAAAITYAETLRDAARAGGAGSDRPDSE